MLLSWRGVVFSAETWSAKGQGSVRLGLVSGFSVGVCDSRRLGDGVLGPVSGLNRAESIGNRGLGLGVGVRIAGQVTTVTEHLLDGQGDVGSQA